MNEIYIKNQADLDSIPVDYNGRIYIDFGTCYNRAVVNRKFKYPVVAWGNSSVEAWENSSVEAWGNSSVEAWGNSSVEARGNSSVVAWGNSSVEAWGNSSVEARENSSVEAWENSSVVARGNSSVEARGNSSVVARGNSSVVARGNSSVEAWENSQIVDASYKHDIKTSGNARIVYNPKTIEEYLEHYGVEPEGNIVKLFKAVHKRGSRYYSDNDSDFEYVVGCVATADSLNTNTNEDCGHGIHIAFREWCVDYGRTWNDLAIIEVEAELDKIVVPVNGCGKVRTLQVKVLREVPLEECGLLGKHLAKRR